MFIIILSKTIKNHTIWPHCAGVNWPWSSCRYIHNVRCINGCLP